MNTLSFLFKVTKVYSLTSTMTSILEEYHRRMISLNSRMHWRYTDEQPETNLSVDFRCRGDRYLCKRVSIDLHAGRRESEIEWLQGAVVRYGEKVGVPTPVNRLLTETLLGMLRGEIPIREYSRQPEKLVNLLASEHKA
jgi:ketopantoate reductase